MRDSLDEVKQFIEELNKAHDERKQRETEMEVAIARKALAEAKLKKVVEQQIAQSKDLKVKLAALATHFILGGVAGEVPGLFIMAGPTGLTALKSRHESTSMGGIRAQTLAVRCPTPTVNPVFLVARDMDKEASMQGTDFMKLVNQYYLTGSYLRASTLVELFSREY